MLLTFILFNVAIKGQCGKKILILEVALKLTKESSYETLTQTASLLKLNILDIVFVFL